MALGGFALLTLLMFGDLLFSSGTTVLGNQVADLFYQFVGWRSFGFQELAKGNLALWNPHIYGGGAWKLCGEVANRKSGSVPLDELEMGMLACNNPPAIWIRNFMGRPSKGKLAGDLNPV
jgi:hypothetical protein